MKWLVFLHELNLRNLKKLLDQDLIGLNYEE